MNDQSQPPRKSAALPDDVKAELLRRVQNLPNEELIDADQVFDQIRRNLRERSTPSPR
jgi:hypothetical protein